MLDLYHLARTEHQTTMSSEKGRFRIYPPIKRLADLAAAAAGLVLAAPVMAVVALAVRCRLGPPVLFSQIRPGRGGKGFTLVKFRTMRNAAGPDGQPLPDAERLTALGRLLRKTSLDELPQLFNVLAGHMSLIGPRPLLVEYLPLYTPAQARRHELRPGITGWAQVNGRNDTIWPRRLELDVFYVDHLSLALDLKILLMTALKVLRREGVSPADNATMPKFTGRETDGEPGAPSPGP